MEYLSKECYEALANELQHMIQVELPKAKDELVEARAKGDLSENFEYHAAKRYLRKLMGQIKFKTGVLQNARILDPALLGSETVGLFRKVTFTNLTTRKQMTYTIVNPHEADFREGKISIKSPIAAALMGKKEGDEVEVQAPAGLMRLKIDSISV